MNTNKSFKEAQKEFGKWLLDIAKYVVTAVVITSVLGNFAHQWVIYLISFVTIAAALILGLYLIFKGSNK